MDGQSSDGVRYCYVCDYSEPIESIELDTGLVACGAFNYCSAGHWLVCDKDLGHYGFHEHRDSEGFLLGRWTNYEARNDEPVDIDTLPPGVYTACTLVVPEIEITQRIAYRVEHSVKIHDYTMFETDDEPGRDICTRIHAKSQCTINPINGSIVKDGYIFCFHRRGIKIHD